jgi:hypothetical protein
MEENSRKSNHPIAAQREKIKIKIKSVALSNEGEKELNALICKEFDGSPITCYI